MKTKNTLLGAITVVAMAFSLTAGAEQSTAKSTPKKALSLPAETITLAPGEQRDLMVKDIVRMAIEDPEIVSVAAPTGSETSIFHMTAGKEGQTNIIVWSKGGARRIYTLIVKR